MRKRRRNVVALLIQPELAFQKGTVGTIRFLGRDYYRENVGFNGALHTFHTESQLTRYFVREEYHSNGGTEPLRL
jgi:hypothetical protein